MSDEGLLEELRALFREEARDGSAALERVAAALEDDAARAAASQDAFRVIHGLKGAARAAQVTGLEAALHALEGRLAAEREVAYADVDAVRAVVAAARAELRGWLDRTDDGEPSRRGVAPTRDAGDVSLGELTPDGPGPRGSALRVRASTVLDLMAASDEALESSSDEAIDGGAGRIDEALADAQLELARLAAIVEDATADREEIRLALGRVVRGAQALAAVHRLATARRRGATRRVRDAIAEMTRLTRRLGATRMDELAPPLVAAAADAARELGKDVDVRCELGDGELDRRIVDALREPLLHLVRNAVDHGLEAPGERVEAGKPRRGCLVVEGAIRGDEAHLVVRDDGRGFDVAGLRRAAAAAAATTTPDATAIELAFLPGVTTRSEATGLSGRGVGLDAVRDRIAQLHGRITVESEAGRGSAIHVVVPTDLSVLRALIVAASGVRLAVASASVVQLGRASWADVTTIEGRTYVRRGGAAVPLFDLGDALGLPPSAAVRDPGARWAFVVVAAGDRTVAIRVDELIDEREVVVRPLGARVRRAAFVAGAIPGDRGDVVLLLDAGDLVTVRPGRPPGDEAPRRQRRVLVVDDSLTTRQLERAMLEAAGYDVRVAEDGVRAWELLETEPFDLVVSDIEMPGLDGLQLLRRIRSSTRHDALPVVLVTALADESDRRRALDLGASGYLLKSRFDQEELLELLARLA